MDYNLELSDLIRDSPLSLLPRLDTALRQTLYRLFKLHKHSEPLVIIK